MKRFVTKKIVMFAGLLAIPVAKTMDVPASVTANRSFDPRLKALKEFFSRYGCPAHRYATEFLQAADENSLDWRLLPSISFLESGGGKAGTKNNIFGWASARTGFRSIPEGIHTVASRLSKSALYRNKDLDGILRTYNPRQEYGFRIKAVMRSIGPVNPQNVAVLN